MRLFLIVLFLSLKSGAVIDVAFFEVRNYHGQIISLEPDGKFAHMAISFQGHWLHAHPLRGVELVSQEAMEKIGRIHTVVRVDENAKLQIEQVLRFLGKPFDSDFTWDNDRIYCSELVAKLLSISPRPMNFKAGVWPDKFKSHEGELGISPDDLYRYFQAKGYTQKQIVISCSRLFGE